MCATILAVERISFGSSPIEMYVPAPVYQTNCLRYRPARLEDRATIFSVIAVARDVDIVMSVVLRIWVLHYICYQGEYRIHKI